MSFINSIVFWEPVLSPHKTDLYNALVAQRPEIKVVVIVCADLSAERKGLGWESPVSSHYQVIYNPSKDFCSELIANNISNQLNIFSGIRWFEIINHGINVVLRTGAKFAILSEPRVDEGLKGVLRWLHSLVAEISIRKSVSFVLAIGRNGPKWYKSVLYSSKYIFGFAYFVDWHPTMRQLAERDSLLSRGGHIIYVGRLIKMKGVKYFIEAAILLKNENYHFSMVGSGDAMPDLKKSAEQAKINVGFIGALKMSEARRIIAENDILILPSITNDDGWGVVISEALLCGCAVIATAKVGASIVLENSRLGVCIPESSADAIADAISFIAKSGMLSESERAYRIDWARSNLTGDAGARYLLSIIDYCFYGAERPEPILGFAR